MAKLFSTGILYIISAELLFATSSLFVKILWQNYGISAFEAAFTRFLIGFLILGIYMLVTKVRIRPKNTRALVSRGFFNALALFFYYYALRDSTLTKANILNMTYPLFIVLLAPVLIKERAALRTNLLVLLAFVGVYLVVDPHFGHIVPGDWWALLSGFTAALAIISLREARKTDSTFTVIFYLMTIGLLANLFFLPTFLLPHGRALLWLVLCGTFGFFGQVLLTIGYKQVVAVKGAMASTSRVLFAAGLGIVFFQEQLTWSLLVGTMLILYATVSVRHAE